MEEKQMKHYTGTKTVKACPMTLGEAEQVLNRLIPMTLGEAEQVLNDDSVEKRDDIPGYLVEYDEDGDNYRTWAPKKVFESTYRVSETHIDRMRIEFNELIERYMRGRKYSFTSKENFDCLLREQLGIMEMYIYKLKERIKYAELEETELDRIATSAIHSCIDPTTPNP